MSLSDRLLDVLEDGGRFAGAGEARDKDVVAGAVDAEAELERADRAVLADEFGTRDEFVRALELEDRRVLGAPKLFDGDVERVVCQRITNGLTDGGI